ncbi:hypothetical protein [Flavobacterium tructae]|uniref:Uncharacterized protein n=1 Tax=Flavobacterium tructae TaxID=1114873 RepID=A0A1S1J1C4_9FLAO|nr:hypothetical protein [Flavobacterium tructae]OHT43295.1 hypothetical protein BHE19_18540 [Flavobacterium tructae]OXB19825.1 hypothetical protein B0A71_10315 [Flavobacterium tructae]
MEPNNFEKDFREKLNQRKIEPSDKAWDRLDAMLSVAEEKKTIALSSRKAGKKKWMYVAASVVGFLLVGTFFFNHKKNTDVTPKDIIVVKEDAKKDSVVKPTLDTNIAVEEAVVVSEEKTIKKSVQQESQQESKSNKIITNKSNAIAESSIIIKNNPEKQSINPQPLKAKNPEKETVDQLLGTAEKVIVAENAVKPKSKVKINANDLLQQVDGELELSFREKVITKVNKNYQTVKMALANRNQLE